MMRTKFIVLSAAVIALLGASCASTSMAADTCPPVESVKIMPLKQQSGYDSAYDRLIGDDACERSLVEATSDAGKMKDPRQAPHDSRFAVGDAAVFIFLIRRNLDLKAILPDEVASRLKDEGVYAYFDFVSTPVGRNFVVERIEKLAGK